MLPFLKRKKFVTHWRHQLGLALVFVFWSVILVLCLIGLFFINYVNVSTETGALVIHDQLLTKMLLVEQAKQLALTYCIAMLLFIFLMGIYVMAYAHRMTGPAYKMNRMLQQAAMNKEWPKPLSFRKDDAFHDLAQSFNEFVEAMQNKK